MNVKDETGMRPELGDTSITLPITFDYSGGRKDSDKSAKIWSIILSVIGIIILLGTIFGNAGIVEKIVVSIVIFVGFSSFIRFVLLKENSKKENYKSYISKDYKLDYKDIWGIYKVENVYPYICRFRNGKSGLYIRLNKDVILGKYVEAEYEHYEAIADAYNLAGAGKVQMVHVDYMDNVGTDERLTNSFNSLEDVSNPDLKDLLTDIYSFQQSNIYNRVNTSDVYVFLWTGNDVTAWNTINRILNCFLDANYRSYKVLNEKDLRELVKLVFNLSDFSISEASSSTFEVEGATSSIIPISVTDVDGVVAKINKTFEEKEADRKAKEMEEIAKSKELNRRKRKKKSKSNSSDDNDILDDIF